MDLKCYSIAFARHGERGLYSSKVEPQSLAIYCTDEQEQLAPN
jgi:hypothetical protein